MRVVFISSWPADNGLSRSTVHPHLLQLATYPEIEQIVYFSVESGPCEHYQEPSRKVVHTPIALAGKTGSLLSRITGQVKLRREVSRQCAELRPDLVICRGAPAGALGHMIHKKCGTPYYVESFEPHADYMAESGIWRRYGIKYLIQSLWERRAKGSATGLITVSTKYAQYLADSDGVPPERIQTVPCWVDDEVFRFDINARDTIRQRLSVGDALVCVYLGQFGGLYYESEAFASMRVLRESFIQPVHFLLLTPTNHEKLKCALAQHGLDGSDYTLLYVDHAEIPQYLSAADFAISFHRAIPMAFSYSPIKYGEYWSCGLPLIAPENVGDDSSWIEEDGLGCTANYSEESSIRRTAIKITEQIEDPAHRERIRRKGLLRRNKRPLIQAYDRIVAANSRCRA